MTIGTNIKRLRVNKGVTQEQLGEAVGVSGQAVSKWENESALPDIQFLPKLAEYFGISIDELMGYKLNALTYKERFVKFMLGNGIIKTGEFELKHGQKKNYYLDTEKFTSNAQIAKIGEYFADCIRENNLEFNVLMGLAYHGIAFSTATACALFNKYGVTVDYCFDRKVADSKGRMICGHTLKDGDKVVLVDEMVAFLFYENPVTGVFFNLRSGYEALAAAALSEHCRRLKPLGAEMMTGGSDEFYKKIGYEDGIRWLHYKKN